jgi:hypothetical protein
MRLVFGMRQLSAPSENLSRTYTGPNLTFEAKEARIELDEFEKACRREGRKRARDFLEQEKWQQIREGINYNNRMHCMPQMILGSGSPLPESTSSCFVSGIRPGAWSRHAVGCGV